MSRVAKAPVELASGVEISIAGQEVTVKGSKGTLTRVFNEAVEVVQEESQIKTLPREGFDDAWAQAGTARALVNSMVVGVSQGFEKKLLLQGVGYRAQVQGNVLKLNLGYSHDVDFAIPDGITVKCAKPTEIEVEGHDKQQVGEVAAKIRDWRRPEPYKGKGIRYKGEFVFAKEGKKK